MLAQDVGHFSVTWCIYGWGGTNLWLFLPPLCTILDENGIVFEVEVSRDEALASLEFYKHTCPGPSSISSLQGVLQAMDRGGVRKHSQSWVYILFTWNFYLAASHRGVCCVQHLSLVYQGRRSRKKTDLSMKMYEEEIQVKEKSNIVCNWYFSQSYRLILFHTSCSPGVVHRVLNGESPWARPKPAAAPRGACLWPIFLPRAPTRLTDGSSQHQLTPSQQAGLNTERAELKMSPYWNCQDRTVSHQGVGNTLLSSGLFKDCSKYNQRASFTTVYCVLYVYYCRPFVTSIMYFRT